jgi:hypothetical protein
VRRSNRPPRSCPASPASRGGPTTTSPRMTAQGPPTFDDGAHKYCRRTWSFRAVASTRCLCENATQSQAASWRAASSFPLVNYLPVAPVHEPGCQLVNHVALVSSIVSILRLWMPAMRSRRRVRVSGARRVRAVIFCERLRGLREHNGEVVGDAAWPAIIDNATQESDPG